MENSENVVENEGTQETEESKKNEKGFKETFDEIQKEFSKKLEDQKEKFEKELKERDEVIKQLMNQKNEEEPEEISDIEKRVRKTLEIIKQNRS